METRAQIRLGLKQFKNIFVQSRYHLDKDTKHVSKKEFANPKINYPPEAKLVVAAIQANPKVYKQMKAVQKEGLFQDSPFSGSKGLSMRDLYALYRRSGYHHERLYNKLEKLETTIAITLKKAEEARLQKAAKQK